MKTLLRCLLVAGLTLSSLPCVLAQSPMKTTKASGPFDVKMTPSSAADAAVGRFVLDKKYHGDLEAAPGHSTPCTAASWTAPPPA